MSEPGDTATQLTATELSIIEKAMNRRKFMGSKGVYPEMEKWGKFVRKRGKRIFEKHAMDIDDVLQDAYEKIIEKGDTGKLKEEATNLMCVVMANTTRDEKKKYRAKKRRLLSDKGQEYSQVSYDEIFDSDIKRAWDYSLYSVESENDI
jgi:DNA-directed RNA polymerase specialized sigma24 family protein